MSNPAEDESFMLFFSHRMDAPVTRNYLVIQPRPMRKEESINDFIRIFEKWTKANNWSDSEAADIFDSLVEDQVLSSRIELLKYKNSFEFIKDSLLETGRTQRDADMIALFNCRIGKKESIDEFTLKVTRLVHSVYPKFEPDEKQLLARDFLLAGLQENVRLILLSNVDLSLKVEDIQSAANAIVNAQKMKTASTVTKQSKQKQNTAAQSTIKIDATTTVVQANSLFCKYCKATGHTVDKCRKIPKNNQQKVVQNTTTTTAIEIGAKTEIKASLFCKHCKIAGHTVDKCRKAPKKK